VLEDHPEYLLEDQVHFTDEGSQALAEIMAETAQACR
jgi:lysophospholipase L1-like esterase